MINEITQYVFGSYVCTSYSKPSIFGNILFDFGHVPTLNEIQNLVNNNYKQYGYNNCTLTSIDFMSKQSFLDLGGELNN